VQLKFRHFIEHFTITNDDDNFEQFPLYWRQLKEMQTTQEFFLDVDCDHLYQYDQGLYRQLENYPTDILPTFDMVANQIFQEIYKTDNQTTGFEDDEVAA